MANIIDNLLDNLLASLSCKYDIQELKEIREKKDDNEILEFIVTNMNNDQRSFYNIIVKHVNNSTIDIPLYNKIFMVSGLPGTGKSYLQSAIFLFILLQQRPALCLTPTNLTAYQQKGKTVHSQIKDVCRAFGISYINIERNMINLLKSRNLLRHESELCQMSLSQLLDLFTNLARKCNVYDKIVAVRNTNDKLVILIDEGTMISSVLLTLLVMKFSNSTFIISYGPNQLPPISDNLNIPSCEEPIIRDKCTNFHTLQTQMRFLNEEEYVFRDFIQYFSKILSNEERDEQEFFLNKIEYYLRHLKYGGNLEDYKNLKDDKKILIVSTNDQRCTENFNRLSNEGEGPVYEIKTILDSRLPSNYNLESRVGIDRILRIKKGVRCIVRVNDIPAGLIKGMMVKIKDIVLDENDEVEKIIIELDNEKDIVLHRYSIQTDYFMIPNDDESVLKVKQFPLALSYSLTAYSAQGKTLDCNVGINIDATGRNDNNLNVNFFFVAITRVKSQYQLYMNRHPVYWLEPRMQVNSLKDLDKIRSTLDNSLKRKRLETENEEMKKRFIDDDDDSLSIKNLSDFIPLYSGNITDINQISSFILKND